MADRYAVERLLGEGGIGQVWLARQLSVGRKVALKMLHPHLGHRPEMTARFEREARATSRVNHPGCVTLFDFGGWNGRLFIAMEYIEGESLADVLGRTGHLPPEEVVEIGAQLCEALEAAHMLDLLHRDLKPENILLSKNADGSLRVRVVDFGLAFLLGEEENRLTREGTVAGTPSYMSPEQALNRPLDPRSDVYAVGCVLYESLAGRQPFVADTAFEVLQRQIYDKPRPLDAVAPQPIPPAVVELVHRCLEKKPTLRPPSAAEVARRLRAAMAPDAHLRSGARDAMASREDRALGTTMTRPAPRPMDRTPEAPAGAITLWAAAADSVAFSDSLPVALGHAGFAANSVDDLPADLTGQVLVVDLRGLARAEASQRLRQAAAHTSRAPIVAVGSDEDFDLLTDALALGIGDFLTGSTLSSLPQRIRKALRRVTPA